RVCSGRRTETRAGPGSDRPRPCRRGSKPPSLRASGSPPSAAKGPSAPPEDVLTLNVSPLIPQLFTFGRSPCTAPTYPDRGKNIRVVAGYPPRPPTHPSKKIPNASWIINQRMPVVSQFEIENHP